MSALMTHRYAAAIVAAAMSVSCIASADASEIVRVAPSTVERGNVVTLVGRDFGDQAGHDVAILRLVNGQIQDGGQPMDVTLWASSRIKAIVPQNLEPAPGYAVVIRSRDQGYSNVVALDVRTASLPRWPLRSGEVIENRCEASRSRQNIQPFPPCPTLGYIGRVDAQRAFPGGLLLLDGDFSHLQQGQAIALVKTDMVYTPEIGRSIHRQIAQHLLPIVWSSPNRVEVAIGNEVYPGTFTLMLVNRLPEFDGLGGIFEHGSNTWDVTIENVWR